MPFSRFYPLYSVVLFYFRQSVDTYCLADSCHLLLPDLVLLIFYWLIKWWWWWRFISHYGLLWKATWLDFIHCLYKRKLLTSRIQYITTSTTSDWSSLAADATKKDLKQKTNKYQSQWRYKQINNHNQLNTKSSSLCQREITSIWTVKSVSNACALHGDGMWLLSPTVATLLNPSPPVPTDIIKLSKEHYIMQKMLNHYNKSNATDAASQLKQVCTASIIKLWWLLVLTSQKESMILGKYQHDSLTCEMQF